MPPRLVNGLIPGVATTPRSAGERLTTLLPGDNKVNITLLPAVSAVHRHDRFHQATCSASINKRL
jgi:hypothetical protein